MSTGSGIPVSPFIVVKAAGEMASAVAWRLYMANMRRICMLDLDQPLCVRRVVLSGAGLGICGRRACAPWRHHWGDRGCGKRRTSP